jgi:hypothetical protein
VTGQLFFLLIIGSISLGKAEPSVAGLIDPSRLIQKMDERVIAIDCSADKVAVCNPNGCMLDLSATTSGTEKM